MRGGDFAILDCKHQQSHCIKQRPLIRRRCIISIGDFTLPRKPSFARYLREARIRRGLSVTDVAEQIGVSTKRAFIFGKRSTVVPATKDLTCLVQGAEVANQGRLEERWLLHRSGPSKRPPNRVTGTSARPVRG